MVWAIIYIVLTTVIAKIWKHSNTVTVHEVRQGTKYKQSDNKTGWKQANSLVRLSKQFILSECNHNC